MSDIESDIPTNPGAMTAYQARVLQEGEALLGQRESEGENWGPVVRLVAAPFVSAARLATFAPGKQRKGLLLWCALFASYCWWKAWPGFKPFADSEVSDLWAKHTAQGWTWVKADVVGDVETREGNSRDQVRDRRYHMSEAQIWGFSRPLPEGGTVQPGTPGPADFIFFVELDRQGRPKMKPDGTPCFVHVGLVKRFVPPTRALP